MSVISRSSRYRLCSSEGSPPSSKLISDIHTPPAPTAYKVAQRILSRNWGSSQLAKLWDYSSTVRCAQASVPFFLGTNLILPGRGAPLRFCGTVFPDWCLPEKDKDIVTQSMGHRQVIPSYTTHNLRGKIPQMARGWERYTLLSQDPTSALGY